MSTTQIAQAAADVLSGDNADKMEVDLGSLGNVRLISLTGREALSTLFTYEGRVHTPVLGARGGDGPIKPERIAADIATVTLRDAWGSQRKVRGLVAEAEVEVHDVGEATVRFVLRPLFYKLTLGMSCRAFQDMTVLDIAQDVFSRAGLEFEIQASEAYEVREYTVQYNESDYDFVCRLLEEEGIYYWFDHSQGSKLVLADRSPSAPDLDDDAWKAGPTGALLRYQPELGLESMVPFVRELGSKPRALAGKHSLGSFDPQKPAFKLAAAEKTDTTDIEVYDAPGANLVDPTALARRAKVGAERAKALATSFEGTTPSVRFAPGRLFELSGHPFARIDGRYVIVSASFTVAESTGPIDMSFSAIPEGTPYRPLLVAPQPKHPGLQTGVVVGPGGSEIHTDAAGRIRVQQHWDREGAKNEASGRWVRTAQRGVAGSMMFPRMGWNILSFGEEGSVDLPVAMARTFDAEHPPPYKLPDNKTRLAYRTATSPGGGTFNEVRFEDKKGAEEMFVNSTGDMNVLVKDTKGDIVRGYMVRKVGIDHSLEVGGTFDLHVEKTQTVKVGANQSESVTADRQKLVTGSETITVGVTRTLKTGVNADTTGEARSLKVGAVNMSATLGGVKAQTKVFNQLVGGAVVKATPRKMSESVGSEVNADTVVGYLPDKAQAAIGKLKKLPGVSSKLAKLKKKAGLAIQTIGAVKFEQAQARQLKVDLTYDERVLGTMALTAATAIVDATKKLLKISTGSFEGTTKTVLLKSETEVVLKSGTTQITVNKAGVVIDAPEVQLASASGFTIPHVKVDINP